MIRVLIADNHILVRAGFKRILEEEEALEVVAECQDADEVLQFMQTERCDVMVLDIDMPGKSGLDLLPELKQKAPDTKILIQSIHPEERYAVRALKAGAVGYITKEAAAEELVNAIIKVHEGGIYVSEAVAESMISDLRNGGIRLPHERLSQREFQVFRELAAGKSTREIKELLRLSLSTINTHRRHILEKMNLKSNSDIVRYALQNDLT